MIIETENPCSLSARYEELDKLLSFDLARDNLLAVIALGGLSEHVRQLWWASEESFASMPSVLLQDSLSLHAQRRWQSMRHDKKLYQVLSEHVKNHFDDTRHYHNDIHLHHLHPDIPLIKFWLTSASCCCREFPIEQDVLWHQHLQLTQSLCIAAEIWQHNPQCTVVYRETDIMLIERETRTILILTACLFSPYRLYDYKVLFYPYPK